MALDLEKQFNLAMHSVSVGDIEMLGRLMTDPDAVSVDDQRTIAQKLGLKKGFLSAAVNTFADPVVWISFLLSKRFPTKAWLEGTIPERFIGAANEWTGFSRYTRPVEQFFRGTNIPNLLALKQRRESEVMKVAERMFGHMQRPNWKDEMPIVSLILEGKTPAGASKELLGVADRIHADMDEMWQFLNKTKKITGGLTGEEIALAKTSDFASHETPRYLRNYLPHIPLLGDESIIKLSGAEAIDALGSHRLARAMAAKGIDPKAVWGVRESGTLQSDFVRYQTFLNKAEGRIFNPRLFQRKRMGVGLEGDGQDLFITDLNVILHKYAHSTARTYALNAPLTEYERMLATTRIMGEDGMVKHLVPTADPVIVQLINDGINATGAQIIQRPVAGTAKFESVVKPGSGSPMALSALRALVRSAAGKADEGEIFWGNMFSAIGAKLDQFKSGISKKQMTEIDAAMGAYKRNQSYRNLVDGTTSFFYASTLGMNPWSAIQNLFQPLLTTAPAIGIGPTLKGMAELRQRIPKYAKELRVQHNIIRQTSANPLHRINESAQKAFNAVFPELAENGIKLDPRLFDVDPNATMKSLGQTSWFKTYDDFAKFLLQPFTHAELSNQATTFFGSKHAIRQAILTGEMEAPAGMVGQALEHWMDFQAGNIVNATQFRPGPGSRTLWQGSVPSFVRMFTSFPTRALSFMMESTVRGASSMRAMESESALGRALGGRNWGTLARMSLYGRMATNGARDVLGIDLGNVLGLTAPFNLAPEGQPFAPLPLPPIAGAVYGTASAALNRDLKEMQPLQVPGLGTVPIPKTLFPGGLELTRIARALNQYKPDMGGFVDENNRLMYRGNTTDFIMAAMGIPSDKQRRARDVVERVQANRDRIRQFRRQYASAYIQADYETMDRLRGQYAKSFPDMPGLDISPKDILRYQQMARIPMVQRMLRTMGASGRYLENDIYDVDPDILAPQPGPMRMAVGGY